MEKIEMQTFFPPRISADTKAFWEGCKAHKLLLQRCRRCGKVIWPAQYLCPDCLSEDLELTEMSGRGTVYSWEVFRRAFHPAMEEKLPYVVAAVDLEEGARMITNLVDCELGQLRCGLPVELRWCDGDEYTRPVFVIRRDEK